MNILIGGVHRKERHGLNDFVNTDSNYKIDQWGRQRSREDRIESESRIRAGAERVSFAVQTAGEPATIMLSSDKKVLKADRQDLSYVAVQMLDVNGLPVPFANNRITFEVTGAGKLAAVGNGDQQSHTPFKGNQMEAWLGKCMAIIQSTGRKGEITVTARSGSLPVAITTLKAE